MNTQQKHRRAKVPHRLRLGKGGGGRGGGGGGGRGGRRGGQ